MKLQEIVDTLGLEIISGPDTLDTEITRGYASDLMSDVIANAMADDIWVTMQVHMNVVAIASMKDIGAVVLTQDRKPLPETLQKSESEGVVLLGCSMTTFEIVGRLYQLGIKGE